MGMHIWDFPSAKYSCSHCPGKFQQKLDFINHINRRKRKKKKNRNAHQLNVDRTLNISFPVESGRIFQCSQYGNKSQYSETNGKKHIVTMHETTGQICKICPKTLNSKHELSRHVWDDHLKQFRCRHCGGQFIRAPGFISHTARIKQNKGKRKCHQTKFSTKPRPDVPNQGRIAVVRIVSLKFGYLNQHVFYRSLLLKNLGGMIFRRMSLYKTSTTGLFQPGRSD